MLHRVPCFRVWSHNPPPPQFAALQSLVYIFVFWLRCDDTPNDRLPYQATTGFDEKILEPRNIHPIQTIAKRNTLATMAEWDLSQKIIPYLDRHLAFPLLAYLTETGLFPAEEVQAAQYGLARKTNMVDFAVNLFEAVYPGEEIPAGESRSHSEDLDSGFWRGRVKRLIVVRSCRVQRKETRGTPDEREVAAGSPGGFGCN